MQILTVILDKDSQFIVQVVLSFYQRHKLTVLARLLLFLVYSFQLYQQYSSDITYSLNMKAVPYLVRQSVFPSLILTSAWNSGHCR